MNLYTFIIYIFNFLQTTIIGFTLRLTHILDAIVKYYFIFRFPFS